MMNLDSPLSSKRGFVRFVAGTVVLASFLAGHFLTIWFYLITIFAGLNLIQSSFTGFCPPEIFYEKVIE